MFWGGGKMISYIKQLSALPGWRLQSVRQDVLWVPRLTFINYMVDNISKYLLVRRLTYCYNR